MEIANGNVVTETNLKHHGKVTIRPESGELVTIDNADVDVNFHYVRTYYKGHVMVSRRYGYLKVVFKVVGSIVDYIHIKPSSKCVIQCAEMPEIDTRFTDFLIQFDSGTIIYTMTFSADGVIDATT